MDRHEVMHVVGVEPGAGALDSNSDEGAASTTTSRTVSVANAVPAVRESESCAGTGNVPLSLCDEEVAGQWCERHGISLAQLVHATDMVGLMPAALNFYLASSGRRTKQVTDAMRAARPPIAPRDRRRKKVGGVR